MGSRPASTASSPTPASSTPASTRTAVVDVLREHRPKVVCLPGHEQRHPDHRITPQLVFDACYFAGLEKFGKGKKHRPFKILYCHNIQFDERRPVVRRRHLGQLEKKIAAVLAYKTQFPDAEKMKEWLRGAGAQPTAR
jgi:LmbE family N-acetylglucosaminyl deacetylase